LIVLENKLLKAYYKLFNELLLSIDISFAVFVKILFMATLFQHNKASCSPNMVNIYVRNYEKKAIMLKL